MNNNFIIKVNQALCCTCLKAQTNLNFLCIYCKSSSLDRHSRNSFSEEGVLFLHENSNSQTRARPCRVSNRFVL